MLRDAPGKGGPGGERQNPGCDTCEKLPESLEKTLVFLGGGCECTCMRLHVGHQVQRPGGRRGHKRLGSGRFQAQGGADMDAKRQQPSGFVSVHFLISFSLVFARSPPHCGVKRPPFRSAVPQSPSRLVTQHGTLVLKGRVKGRIFTGAAPVASIPRDPLPDP